MSAVADLALPEHLKDDPGAIQELAELEAIFDANPLEAYNHPEIASIFPTYKVHEKQMEFHAIKPPPLGIKALIAANRSGKTVACVVDDIIQLLPEELVPTHLKPFKKFEGPVVIWVGAPKTDNHLKNTIPLFRKFLPKAALKEGKFNKSFRSQPTPEIQLVGGSVIVFKSYDQDRDAWASAEVHRIHWDEEPNIADSAGLRTEASFRLVSTEGDEIIGMTPLLGYSWVYEDVWCVRDTDPQVSVMQMGMEDNPYNTPLAIAKVEARCKTEEDRRMRLHGEFVHLGGVFFSEFREKLHVVDPVGPDHLKGQDIVVGIDPGRNRTGVVWLCFDSDNAGMIFDEYNPAEAIVSDVAAEIKRRNEAWGVKEEPTYVIDPSARNTSAINADQVAAAFARSEIYCEYGQNSRAAGILEIKRRLQGKDKDENPDPTLVIARNCTQTIKQFEDYRRDPNAVDEWKAIPQTDYTRYDLVDAARYACMSRNWEFPEEIEAPQVPPHFDHITEPPFDPSEFLIESPPLGDLS